jgi:hypothetical protein
MAIDVNEIEGLSILIADISAQAMAWILDVIEKDLHRRRPDIAGTSW